VVLAVLQQALLTPLGADSLLYGVKRADGRFTVLSTDASNLPAAGRPAFLWSKAAPVIASLRQQEPDGLGSVVECGDRYLYRYSRSVAESRDQVVVGVLFKAAPNDIAALRVAVSSAIYTLLPESSDELRNTSVSVSIGSEANGFSATVSYRTGPNLVRATKTATTVALATAEAAVEASGASLRLRFADQIAVAGTPVSLVVADSAEGAVVGASDLVAPGTVAPALAVLKAARVVARMDAESGVDTAALAQVSA
jgi:hypothetical protein